MQTLLDHDRFELRDELGRGGMGIVYAAYDRRRDREVALKLLRQHPHASPFRFKREFRTVANLRHPNLVRLYDLCSLADGGMFFTMALINGHDLVNFARTTSSNMPVTADETLQLGHLSSLILKSLAGVGESLLYLHGQQLIHRDLKPSNIICGEDGHAYLLDFGIVRDISRGQDITVSGAVGTPRYMAPEQILGQEVGPAADLYALGCVLYELLAGTFVFNGDPTSLLLHHVHTAPRPPSAHRACDPELETLCLALLHKLPQQRPSTHEVRERLCRRAGLEPLEASVAKRPDQASFQGRERELKQLHALYEQSRNRPTVVLVGGKGGTGKSALATAFAHSQRLEGTQAWFSTCSERENVPYKAFDAIVDGVTASLISRGKEIRRLLPVGTDAITRLFPVLSEVPLVAERTPQSGLADGSAERERAFYALFSLLANLCDGAPAVLVIDDLQRADADSMKVLSWLTRTPDAPPVLIVCTYRPDELTQDGPMGQLLGELDASHLNIEPLPATLVAHLIQAHATDTLSEGQCGLIAQEAEGNVQLAIQLARVAGQLAPEDPVPTLRELAALIGQQLARVEAKVLAVIAANGGRTSFSVLQAVLDDEPAADLADSLDQLLAQGLVREAPGRGDTDLYDLYHDLIRPLVYERIPDDAKQRFHRRLAEQYSSQDEAARAVEHWRLSSDDEQAYKAALSAAKRAEEQLAFDRAAQLYAIAADHTEAVSVQRQLAESLAKAGRRVEAAEVFERALAKLPPVEARELALRAASERLAAGDLKRGIAGLETLLNDFGETTQKRVLLSIITTSAYWAHSVLKRGGRRLGEAIGLCNRYSEPTVDEEYRLALYTTAFEYFATYDPVRAQEFGIKHQCLALSFSSAKHRGRGHLTLAHDYLYTIGPRVVPLIKRHIAKGEALCAEAADPAGLMHALVLRSFLGLWQNNWRGLNHYVEQADALAKRHGLVDVPSHKLVVEIHFLAQLLGGNLHELAERIKRIAGEARRRGNNNALSSYTAALGWIHYEQGASQAAQQALDEARSLSVSEPPNLENFHVEMYAIARDLACRTPEEGLARIAALRKRGRKRGLIVGFMAAAVFRLQRARLLIQQLVLEREQGRVPRTCRCRLGRSALFPDVYVAEALRLRAAGLWLANRPRRALRLLNRSAIVAENRGHFSSLGAALFARALVRKHLARAGSDHDHKLATLYLDQLGVNTDVLRADEGWREWSVPAS